MTNEEGNQINSMQRVLNVEHYQELKNLFRIFLSSKVIKIKEFTLILEIQVVLC